MRWKLHFVKSRFLVALTDDLQINSDVGFEEDDPRCKKIKETFKSLREYIEENSSSGSRLHLIKNVEKMTQFYSEWNDNKDLNHQGRLKKVQDMRNKREGISSKLRKERQVDEHKFTDHSVDKLVSLFKSLYDTDKKTFIHLGEALKIYYRRV